MIKVLLVDDDTIVTDVLKDKIDWTVINMEVVGAVNCAADALAFLHHQPVDLMITDMKMPQMDGNDLIQRALSYNKDIRFLVLSAYTDYELVRRSFKLGVYDYMQKSIVGTKPMYDILKKIGNEILHLNNPGSELISKTLTSFGVKTNGRYTIFCISFVNSQTDYESLEKLVQSQVENIVLHIIKIQTNYVILAAEHKLSKYNAPKDEKAKIANHIRERLADSEVTSIGVSSTSTGTELDRLEFEAMQAASCDYYSTNRLAIYDYADTVCLKQDEQLTSEYWRSLIREQLMHLNIDGALDYIHEMTFYLAHAQPEKEKCCGLVFDIYFYFVSFMINNRILSRKEEIETDHTTINNTVVQFKKFADLSNWIEGNLDKIQLLFSLQYKNNVVDIIKVYVNLNLSEALSLRRIANRYGVNSSYISHLFRQKEGLPLMHYVNAVRLERAKDYLANTFLKIKDVSEAVGFENVEHFTRVFKKKYGVSPHVFRDRFQNNSDCIQL